MKILGIILIIIAILLFALIIIAQRKGWKIDVELIAYFIIVSSVFGGAILGIYAGVKKGSIQALKNNNAYKMEIRYELKDSIYTPIDALYIEVDKVILKE